MAKPEPPMGRNLMRDQILFWLRTNQRDSFYTVAAQYTGRDKLAMLNRIADKAIEAAETELRKYVYEQAGIGVSGENGSTT